MTPAAVRHARDERGDLARPSGAIARRGAPVAHSPASPLVTGNWAEMDSTGRSAGQNEMCALWAHQGGLPEGRLLVTLAVDGNQVELLVFVAERGTRARDERGAAMTGAIGTRGG